MTIEKLPEFASKTDAKNTDQLNLEQGFPVRLKPARQWFNWLFNAVTVKTNQIIDELETKLPKDANAVSASKLAVGRLIGGIFFDGGADIDLPGVNKSGNQDTTGNAETASKLKIPRKVLVDGVVKGEALFDGSDDLKLTLATVGREQQPLRVEQIENGVITYDDDRKIVVIEMYLWKNSPVVKNSTKQNNHEDSRIGSYDLPITLRQRLSANVVLTGEGAKGDPYDEVREWLINIMPNAYLNKDATKTLCVNFERWRGGEDEAVTGFATIVGTF